MRCISNIAGDKDDGIKRILINEGVIDLVCDVSTTFPGSEDFIENISWLITNITADPTFPKFHEVIIFSFYYNELIEII